MDRYTYENITLNITTADNNYMELGETHLELSSSFIANLLEHACTFTEFFVHRFGDVHEIQLEIGDDIDDLIKYYNSLDETLVITDPDVIIG